MDQKKLQKKKLRTGGRISIFGVLNVGDFFLTKKELAKMKKEIVHFMKENPVIECEPEEVPDLTN